jgi:hypothetical protein
MLDKQRTVALEEANAELLAIYGDFVFHAY